MVAYDLRKFRFTAGSIEPVRFLDCALLSCHSAVLARGRFVSQFISAVDVAK